MQLTKNHTKSWLLVGVLITILLLAGCGTGTSEDLYSEEMAPDEREEMPAVEEPISEEPQLDESEGEEPVTDEPSPDEMESEEPAVEVTPPEIPAAEPPEPQTEPEPAPEPEPEPQEALSGTLVNGVREIDVVAYQFDFGPDPIRVQQGETVRLRLTTDDVAHGIGLSQFGINTRINAGETAEVTFVADVAGEFMFFCTVPCGPGHQGMTGQLIVL